MDPIDRIARIVYATLNRIPEESFSNEDQETQDLYREGATAVLETLAAEGFEERARTLAHAAKAADAAGDDVTSAWIRDYAAPPAPAASVREAPGSTKVGNLTVSRLGADADEWFVTGTANIDIATGAIVQTLTDQHGDQAFLTDISKDLIASTPVASTRWVETPGADGTATLLPATAENRSSDEFAGVKFYRAGADLPVSVTGAPERTLYAVPAEAAVPVPVPSTSLFDFKQAASFDDVINAQ